MSQYADDMRTNMENTERHEIELLELRMPPMTPDRFKGLLNSARVLADKLISQGADLFGTISAVHLYFRENGVNTHYEGGTKTVAMIVYKSMGIEI
jgi:hypothetical protein